MVLVGSPGRRGFTLIEMIFVLAMMGILFAITIPRIRVSTNKKVRLVAQQLVRDLEVARTRALATKQNARIVFNEGDNSYTGYLDDDRDGLSVSQKPRVMRCVLVGKSIYGAESYSGVGAPARCPTIRGLARSPWQATRSNSAPVV